MISRYCASLGVGPDEIEVMNYLEVDLLNLPGKFVPLVSSAQTSSEERGRPRLSDEELTDSGEQSREDGVDDGDW